VALPQDDTWLEVRPRFRSDAVVAIRFQYRLDKILNDWSRTNEVPPEDVLRNLEREPSIGLVFSSGWRASSHIIINSEVVYQLLLRFSGYFTIAACLDSFTRGWRIQNLAPLRERLTFLAQAGVIEIGTPARTRGNEANRQESHVEIAARG
jgi:hypothetical protein